MSLVIDSHNHIGDRHGMSQTGAELVAKLDATGVDRAVIMPFVEGTIDNDVIDREARGVPRSAHPVLRGQPVGPRRPPSPRSIAARDLGMRGIKLHPDAPWLPPGRPRPGRSDLRGRARPGAGGHLARGQRPLQHAPRVRGDGAARSRR